MCCQFVKNLYWEQGKPWTLRLAVILIVESSKLLTPMLPSAKVH